MMEFVPMIQDEAVAITSKFPTAKWKKEEFHTLPSRRDFSRNPT
jgi:hypothetical protein